MKKITITILILIITFNLGLSQDHEKLKKRDFKNNIGFIVENNLKSDVLIDDERSQLVYEKNDSLKLLKTLSNESFIDCFNSSNDLIILLAIDNGKSLRLERCKSPKIIETTDYILDSITEFNNDHEKLSHELTTPYRISSTRLSKIEINKEIELSEFLNNKRKLYYSDEIIYLTVDNQDYTHVIELNYINKELKFHSFKNELESSNSVTTKNNSFIFENYLFQIKSNQMKLLLQAFNIENDQFLRSYGFSIGDSIDFKNSIIYYKKKNEILFKGNEISKTKKFLKFIIKSDIQVISNWYDKDKMILTIGGIYLRDKPSSHTYDYYTNIHTYTFNETISEKAYFYVILDKNFNNVREIFIRDK